MTRGWRPEQSLSSQKISRASSLLGVIPGEAGAQRRRRPGTHSAPVDRQRAAPGAAGSARSTSRNGFRTGSRFARLAFRNDAGRNDAGRNDAGRNDAGRNDAGRNDAGRNDAGMAAEAEPVFAKALRPGVIPERRPGEAKDDVSGIHASPSVPALRDGTRHGRPRSRAGRPPPHRRARRHPPRHGSRVRAPAALRLRPGCRR
jgi:hypothetical protein